MDFSNYIFPVLYEDEDFIAIHKPCGILTHRTPISEDTQFVLQLLRQQIKQRVYPVHRLDRATSGILIFGKNKAAAGALAQIWRDKKVEKTYLALIRGHLPEEGSIDYALAPEPEKAKQEAVTNYRRLAQTEIEVQINRYPQSRYSLVEVYPQTGRRHQIRRHFAHLRHPIIGDKRYGDNKHNRHFREIWNIGRLLLHASELSFTHPFFNNNITIQAKLGEDFKKILAFLRLNFPS